MDLTAPLIGIVAGFVVGVTSTGGGALLTPALVFILRVPPSLAVGSDVLIASVTKLFGGGSYALRGQVHWPTVGRLLAGSLPGAVLGIFVLNRLPAGVREHALQRGLGGVLVVAGLATRVPSSSRAACAHRRARRGLDGRARFATGLRETTSIGSGSPSCACSPSSSFPRRRWSAPTSCTRSSCPPATLGHLRRGASTSLLAATVLAGSVPGVLLGARVAHVIPQRALRPVLAVILIGLGIPIAWPGAFSHVQAG
jgi:uncharacterized membrane protein YfcA